MANDPKYEEYEPEEDRQEGVFIEVDADDPFVGLELRAIADDNQRLPVGGLKAEPGRYELRRVDDGGD